ncbi:MAG: phosphoribosylformylglycinamidine cyclo-ligase [Planctomycetes bacterium]|nr:phosphoribosylformylglycinamidine cyclo-ligase [Planctomycetota bacterium]
MTNKLTYKDAGVDIDRKEKFTSGIVKLMRRTYDPRVLDNPKGFAGLFALNPRGQLFRKNYKRPVLVGCTDGVGTKLKIAFMMDKHDTIGIDLVAMSVNDLIVQGAEPLFFLDYIAIGQINDEILHQLMKGIVAGCTQARCALLGGETAEMPDFYKKNEYELAGFAVGLVEKNRIINGQKVRPGDIVLGLASNGLHSNGYSLVRKVFFQKAKKKVTDRIPDFGRTLGEELLEPTRIYAQPMKDLLNRYRTKKVIKGIAHITGGGFLENIPRVLPRSTSVVIEENTWPVPPIFSVTQQTGNVPLKEMYRVFNMGIGLVLIVDPYYVNAIIKKLKKSGEEAYVIGRVTKGQRQVSIK